MTVCRKRGASGQEKIQYIKYLHCQRDRERVGKDLAPHRIGKHSDPQNRAKIDQKYSKNMIFGIFGVFFPPISLVGALSYSVGGQVFRKEGESLLERSLGKGGQNRRWGQGPGSVDPRFPAGLPFPVLEILEFAAFRDPGKFFQQFSRDFPGVFLENPRTDPGNSHSLLEFSENYSTRLFASRCGSSGESSPAILEKEKDDDHDQDSLKKAFRHIWSWSSENWFLEKTKTMTMTKIPSRKPSGTYGHGPLINLFQFWESCDSHFASLRR